MDELNSKEIGKISATMDFLKRDMNEVKQDLKNVPQQIAQSHTELKSDIKTLSDSLEKHYVSQEEFQPVKENFVTKEEFKHVKDRQDITTKYGGAFLVAILLTLLGAILKLILK